MSINLKSTQEAADILGISRRRVQKLCDEGRLGQLVGGRYVISEDELKQFAQIPREAGNPTFKISE